MNIRKNGSKEKKAWEFVLILSDPTTSEIVLL